MAGAPKKRAARVAAPGAQRVVFTGVMAVPDNFGRLRILLLERFADGAYDGSWATLVRELPRTANPPYELWPDGPRADDGTRGVVTVAVPARYRKHWGGVAEGLRGREVRVETTVRPYMVTDPASGAAIHGVALDLAMLEARGARAAQGTGRDI